MKQVLSSAKSRFPVLVPWYLRWMFDLVDDASLIIFGCISGLIIAGQTPEFVGQAQTFAVRAFGLFILIQVAMLTARYLTKEAD